jgi:hypothetical protein
MVGTSPGFLPSAMAWMLRRKSLPERVLGNASTM